MYMYQVERTYSVCNKKFTSYTSLQQCIEGRNTVVALWKGKKLMSRYFLSNKNLF